MNHKLIVIDTNVLISAALSPDGTARKALLGNRDSGQCAECDRQNKPASLQQDLRKVENVILSETECSEVSREFFVSRFATLTMTLFR